MPVPTNVSTLQDFLELENYNGNFIPNIHVLRAPLNKLLTKDSKWNRITECQSTFKEIKISTSDLSLTHYDSKKDIIIASDAGNLGLGAVILHNENNSQVKAIAHALRTLLCYAAMCPAG